METPEGFRRVSFSVISDDGHRLPAQISCLVCRECQAMVLQNDFGDFAIPHRQWHEKINRQIFDVDTELTLIDGEWEEREVQRG